MIVENEIIEAMVLQKLLELWGYDVGEIATSGEEAIKKAKNEKPHLVLMDLSIYGETDGIEVAERINSQFGIPIIFMTGYSDEETTKKARIANPAGYFTKPLDYDKLKVTIESIIHKLL